MVFLGFFNLSKTHHAITPDTAIWLHTCLGIHQPLNHWCIGKWLPSFHSKLFLQILYSNKFVSFLTWNNPRETCFHSESQIPYWYTDYETIPTILMIYYETVLFQSNSLTICYIPKLLERIFNSITCLPPYLIFQSKLERIFFTLCNKTSSLQQVEYCQHVKLKLWICSHQPSYKRTDKRTGCWHIYQKYIPHIWPKFNIFMDTKQLRSWVQQN